jgi:hypothetical protein
MQRPRWRLIGEAYEVVLTPWGAERERRADALTEAQAMRALDAIVGLSAHSVAARTLAECARYLTARYGRVVPLAGDDRAVVRAALARGVLTAWRTGLQYVAAPSPGDLDSEAIARIPLASALLPKTWIEIELTDMEGNPMPGERYWIQLPDGRVREGSLDRHGRAYFGDLDPGQCEIRWPDRDDEATVPARAVLEAPPPREKTWVEIELTDMEGNPMPGEAYWIQTPDGQVRQGKLDRAGRAYFSDLDPGQCEVRWPNLDDDAHVAALDATVGHPESNDNDAQAQTLIDAARDGVPFCEECERARRAQARSGARA